MPAIDAGGMDVGADGTESRRVRRIASRVARVVVGAVDIAAWAIWVLASYGVVTLIGPMVSARTHEPYPNWNQLIEVATPALGLLVAVGLLVWSLRARKRDLPWLLTLAWLVAGVLLGAREVRRAVLALFIRGVGGA